MKKVINDIQWAISFLQKSGHWPLLPNVVVDIALTSVEDNADVASSITSVLAPLVQKTPREIALELQAQLRPRYEKIMVHEDGCLFFRCTSNDIWQALQQTYIHHTPRKAPEKDNRCPFLLVCHDMKTPMSLGELRAILVHDVLANIYALFGWRTHRVVVHTMRDGDRVIIGESVTRRSLQRMGVNVVYEPPFIPGPYMRNLAARLTLQDDKMTSQQEIEQIKDRIATEAITMMRDDMKKIIEEQLGITVDAWESTKVQAAQHAVVSSEIQLREGERIVKAVTAEGEDISAAELLEAFTADDVRLLFLLSSPTRVCDIDLHRLEKNAPDNPMRQVHRACAALASCHERITTRPTSHTQSNINDQPSMSPAERMVARYVACFPWALDYAYTTNDVRMVTHLTLQLAASMTQDHEHIHDAQLLTAADKTFKVALQLLGIHMV